MNRFFWLAVVLCTGIHAQTSPRYGTLLWKISGNGLKKPSYLYGTMHVSNRVAYYLSEEFFDALRNVEVVGLETNPGEWLDNMEKTGELSQLTRVNEPFTRNFYKSAFHLSFPEKRIFQGILSYDPDIINGLLYRTNKSRENFEESTYIDLFIYQTATKLDKRVISLEDFTRSEIMSRLSSVPDQETEENNRQYADYVNAQKIEDAYRQGNLDVIDSLSKLSTSRNMQKYLIVERNFEFVQTMDSVMKGSSLFSGVGAAHLPGEQGVIELLRKKGYSVEPVEPSISKKSHKEREKLDEMVKPVSFSVQYANDSLFSVELPGKLYKILDAGQLKYYVHADMVNGSFYSVARLKHMGPLFNVTAAQVYSKVDSLLFEHIPGRIIERNQISSGGYQGIEVLNRTRSGDDQRYQIFFTDQEMILFKLGGKGSYAASEDAKRFFSSIKFAPVQSKSHLFTPPTGGFSVQVTGEFYYEKNEQTGIAGLCEDLFLSKGKKAMGVRHAVYNDFNYLEEDTFELNQLVSSVLQSFNYNSDRTFTVSTRHQLPVITFTGKSQHGRTLAARIFIQGVHYYLVYETDSAAVDIEGGFIGSFVPGDFRHVHPIKKITDQELQFTAYDEVTDDAYSRFSEMYAKAYENALGTKDSVAPSGYRSLSKFYYSPSSNEYVGISFEQYSDYDYRDPATAGETLEKNFGTNTTMFVAKRSEKTNGGTREFNYVLGDTATQRVLGVRIIYSGNKMYELTAPYDSVVGMRGWQKKFFESFAPLDSSGGNSIFGNSFQRLLTDLSGTDTALRQRANRSLRDGLSMHTSFAGEFISFISGPEILKVSEDSKAYLFVNGGTMRDNRVIAPYKKLYLQYTDSFYLQLCLLKGLAYVKTPEAFAAFAELIRKEPPLVGDEASVADVFSVLRDSLELCKGFFPPLLALTRYEEFRNPIYNLLAELVDRKLVNPSRFTKERETIVADAMLALKRYNPSAKADADETSLSHLDRQARELAETIRRSLEGLANNLQNNPAAEPQTQVKNPLVDYATILAPLYKKDEQVKQFFNRLQRVKSNDILLPATVSLLRYDVTISDSLVQHYASDPHTRAYYYSELERHGIEHKFDSRYLSQQKLIESLLISQRQLNSLYGYERSRTTVADSLELVQAMAVRNKYQKGTMYVFRTARGRGDGQWSAVFVNHAGGDVTSRMELLSAGYTPDPAKSEQENLTELAAHFQLSYRKRALVNAGS